MSRPERTRPQGPAGGWLRGRARFARLLVVTGAAPFLVAALAACETPSQWGPPAVGFVYGTITDAAGTHLPQASVSARALNPDCSENTSFPPGQDTTGADGRYRAQVATWPGIGQYETCVGVTVSPPAGSALSPRTVTGSHLTLHSPPLAPPESVRVDVQLQP